jgi:DNA-binding transcriptional regulator YiaG
MGGSMDPDLAELKRLHEFYKSDRFSKLGIAIALGVDRRTVRRWFQGKNPPTEEHVKLIKELIQKLQTPSQSSI